MKVVKFTTPFKHEFLRDQLDPSLNYQFEIDNDCSACDYWIIWGDIPEEKERMDADCPPQNILFMTDEAFIEKKFNEGFLNQFSAVITCRDDIRHSHLIQTHEINTWHLRKTFSQVYNTDPIIKNKTISVVSSDLTTLPGHKKRYAFVNRLIGHFKDRLDVFGRGFNPVADKWDALAPYKYSIAIENSAHNGYFTEKLTECYLAHTFPIYFGAPDIANYFDSSCLMRIDINDYKTSIQSIEKLIEEDPWENVEQVIIQQKILYLRKYHLFNALAGIMDQMGSAPIKRKTTRIKAHRTFNRYYRLKKIAKAARKLLES